MVNKNKRRKLNRVFLITSIILILFLILGALYYSFNLRSERFEKSGTSKKIVNPVSGLSLEDAIHGFNVQYLNYLLISLDAGKLHSPPFSSDTPKIEFFVEDEIYSVEIIDGRISINEGGINDNDLAIRTTREEIIKMMLDKGYVLKSFDEGLSNVELIANSIELISKGYLRLYQNLNE